MSAPKNGLRCTVQSQGLPSASDLFGKSDKISKHCAIYRQQVAGQGIWNLALDHLAELF